MTPKIEMLGRRFGRLTVVARDGTRGHNVYWRCFCDCGNEKIVCGTNLSSGRTLSCGCLLKDTITNKAQEKFAVLVGQVINGWKILGRGEISFKNQANFIYVEVECVDCGSYKTSRLGHIQKNVSRCQNCDIEYHCPFKPQEGAEGLSHTLIYQRWVGMVDRCYRPSADNYKHYGAQGIRVSDDWTRKDGGFLNFQKWSYENYPNLDELLEEGYQIDRIDTTGNYEPDNCRFITSVSNQANKRNNFRVDYMGGNYVLIDLVRNFSLNSLQLVRSRIKIGWDVEEALIAPKGYRKGQVWKECLPQK